MMREMTDKDFLGMADEEISETMTDGEYFSDMTDEVNTEMPSVDYLGRIIEERIRRAKLGDTYAAKELMKDFCGGLKTTVVKKGVSQRVDREPSIDERILRYFGECFNQILDGVKVERAMCLEKSEGRQSNPRLKEKDIDLAIELELCIKSNPGKPMTDVYAEVSGAAKDANDRADSGKSQSKLKSVRTEHGELAKLVLELKTSFLDELDN